MKNNYNKFDKNLKNDENLKTDVKKNTRDYSYYSRILEKPFDSIEELKEAEAVYYEAQRAKETKAATKKADAQKVEDAFIALNKARRTYKENLEALALEYSDSLIKLKEAFEGSRNDIKKALAEAEDNYSAAIKEFTDKYPEGYHLTLKDGDFETTISGSKTASDKHVSSVDLLNWIFNI